MALGSRLDLVAVSFGLSESVPLWFLPKYFDAMLCQILRQQHVPYSELRNSLSIMEIRGRNRLRLSPESSYSR
jgi:hypothetical protein